MKAGGTNILPQEETKHIYLDVTQNLEGKLENPFIKVIRHVSMVDGLYPRMDLDHTREITKTISRNLKCR